ncbi:phage integrase N-terminal SAM-like domain-containing protein [Gordonia amicalis]|nr:phage integrase N-terminal SAM-like domain-containing protein [Gordonia amicalis]
MVDLVESWVLSLRAARKSPGTIANYTTGVRQFLEWCETTDTPAVLDRATVNGFIAHLLDVLTRDVRYGVRRVGAT